MRGAGQQFAPGKRSARASAIFFFLHMLRAALPRPPPHARAVAVIAARASTPVAAACLRAGAALRLPRLRSEFPGAEVSADAAGRGAADGDGGFGLAALRLGGGAGGTARMDVVVGGGGGGGTHALGDLWLPIHTLCDVAAAVRELLDAD